MAVHFIYLEQFSFVSVAIHFGYVFSLFVIELVLVLYLHQSLNYMYLSKLVITMHCMDILYSSVIFIIFCFLHPESFGSSLCLFPFRNSHCRCGAAYTVYPVSTSTCYILEHVFYYALQRTYDQLMGCMAVLKRKDRKYKFPLLVSSVSAFLKYCRFAIFSCRK